MDFWHIQIPTPVALAFVAAMGYLINRWRRPVSSEVVDRSRRDLKRAQAVALELEKIAFAVRQSLANHHASLSRFKDRVSTLGDARETAGKELCRETEEILRPTLKLATQIANAYDEIRQQTAHLMTFAEARTDPLTGVNNRRGLDDVLSSQLGLTSRYGSVFSLALFDIDHFKQVNDREGHLYGDRVLQELGRLLDSCVRETDIVGRYGGEEFLVVMPQTDLAGAGRFAERMRREVAARLGVTVSGGLAAARAGDTADSIIARADRALYAAKRAGRNQLYCHTGEEEQPLAADEPVAAAT
jgi:diguanylate cyclase (GGDEF)-like protein